MRSYKLQNSESTFTNHLSDNNHLPETSITSINFTEEGIKLNFKSKLNFIYLNINKILNLNLCKLCNE